MRFTKYPLAKRKLLMANRNVGRKIIQKRLASLSHIVDGRRKWSFQCIASNNAKPVTNINNPTGRSFEGNLLTGISPANNAMYNPITINPSEGRMFTSKELDAAEGDDGTVRNEAPKSRKPITPRTLPNFFEDESFLN